jgi:antibiotic biosynthesis monooxygenase (ABM) superfamily enzyme
VPKPALFVVKATIAPEREADFNEWYNTRRAAEAAQVPGLVAMRRYVPVPVDVGVHPGAEPWQYMVVYEFDSEESLRNFAASETLRAMTVDYEARFGGAGNRARLTYRQVFP